MNSDQIESLPSVMEANYYSFRESIRAELVDALENGDAELAMRKIYGDFMKALSHTLDEYGAPDVVLERVTTSATTIAQAPDLLDALRAAQMALIGVVSRNEAVQSALDMADKAITKATTIKS